MKQETADADVDLPAPTTQDAEPKDEEEEHDGEDVKIAVDAFLKKPATKLVELQKAATEAKLMISQTSSVRYAESSCDDVRKLSSRLDKDIKMVEKVAVGEPVHRPGAPKLLQKIQEHLESFHDLKSVGIMRFGVALDAQKPPKRRRGQ